MKRTLLTVLRDNQTPPHEFRRAADRLSYLLATEIAVFFEANTAVQTPIGPTAGYHLRVPVLLVPVLRAGLAMVPTFLEAFPKARTGRRSCGTPAVP